MNASLLDSSESGLPPLGPAISPRATAHASSIGQMAEPLAPFGSRPEEHAHPTEPVPEAIAPAAEELTAIDTGSGAVDDLPWLGVDADDLLFDESDKEEDEDEEEEDAWVGGDRWIEDFWDEEPEPGPARNAGWRTAPDDWDIESPHPASSADAVAERLEEIARTLRDQGSAGLLIRHAHDPLQLLIAGYALGYAAAMDELRAPRKF